MRKILVMTGSRSEYGVLYSLLKEIKKDKALNLQLVVTGMHLSPFYGLTAEEIKKDKFKVMAKIESLLDTNTKTGRLKSLALQLLNLIQIIEACKPDLLLGSGDREEVLNLALAGTYLDIPMAHLSGGDYCEGNVDDSVRHAITKLAHLHFPTNKEAAKRILRMGEEPWRIFLVGNPRVDLILRTQFLDRKEICRKFSLDEERPYILLVFHPLSSEMENSGRNLKEIIKALKRLKIQTIAIYPNSDAGGKVIIEILKESEKKMPFLKLFPSINHLDYLNLLRFSSVLLGNSSSGVFEAPYFGIPVVNVGDREKNRLVAENFVFVEPKELKILQKIKQGVFDKEYRKRVSHCKRLYGDGRASEKIIRVLKEIKLDKKLLIKKMTY